MSIEIRRICFAFWVHQLSNCICGIIERAPKRIRIGYLYCWERTTRSRLLFPREWCTHTRTSDLIPGLSTIFRINSSRGRTEVYPSMRFVTRTIRNRFSYLTDSTTRLFGFRFRNGIFGNRWRIFRFAFRRRSDFRFTVTGTGFLFGRDFLARFR